MMTLEEFYVVSSAECRQAIEDNIERDTMEIAADKRLKNARLVATQVKYLQRAKDKLPDYYRARCVIPGLAFEQSSGERVAAQRGYGGGSCCDLTCGLGVDAYWLSKSFGEVVAVERNSVLAEVARYNFKLLGAENIEVVCGSAEDFLRNDDRKFDLVFADPDRRSDDGKKLVALSTLSPNMVEILPMLRQKSDKIVVKLSPLFDVDEAFRVFGEGTKVEVVSVGGENKEVVVELKNGGDGAEIVARAVGIGSVEYKREQALVAGKQPVMEQMKYLYIPDAALQKARVAVKYLSEHGVEVEDENSYGFSDKPLELQLARRYRIVRLEEYAPKRLKKELKRSGVKRLNIMRRNFPHPTNKIVKELGISEGGDQFAVFTTIRAERWVIFIERE